MPEVPLRRNRDFILLQAGQLLSSAGTQSTAIAYPLLVLAFTHSPSKAGIVGFADFLPAAMFGLLAGVAADRWNRKRVMLTADVVQAVAIATLAAAILDGRLSIWLVAGVAFVEGTAASFFGIASNGAMRAVVPPRQMPTAAGTMQARMAVVRLAGPPLGGALFGIARALPFVVDAISYVFSVGTLVAMRTPFQEEHDADPARIRSQIAEGFRFLWRHPFLRTVALIFSFSNFVFTGLMLAVVVIGKRQGLASGEVGALVAAFGGCAVVGALFSGVFRRYLSMRAILLSELWASVGLAAFVARPTVYVLTAALLPQTLLMPVTDTVLAAYRFAVTPDRLIGRVVSVARNIGVLFTPFGALAAGFLLGAVSARAAIAVFAAVSFVLAVWGTLSPSIRTAPSLDELIEPEPLAI
ncbi:MAG TPA: MFS transporter [Gaiellaceae bacterium]